MLRSIHSRIRFCIGALGCVVLGTSLLIWAHDLHAAADRYTWVKVNSPNAPRAETAELWHVSAGCVRPYFVRALLRSKAKLNAYYNLAPDEIRTRLNRLSAADPSVKQAGWRPLEKADQEDAGRSVPDKEYVAELHVKYAEWYADLFKLEIQANGWERRLTNVADQTVLLSTAARKSFLAYSGGEANLISTPADFDDYLLTALGLGGFPNDEEQSLKSDCVSVNLVKETFQSPDYFRELWRWPVDCPASFSFGLELLLISIFFAPAALWVGTGDPAVVKQHIHDVANRLVARVRDFDRDEFMSRVMEWLRRLSAIGRSLLTKLSAASGAIRW